MHNIAHLSLLHSLSCAPNTMKSFTDKRGRPVKQKLAFLQKRR